MAAAEPPEKSLFALALDGVGEASAVDVALLDPVVMPLPAPVVVAVVVAKP